MTPSDKGCPKQKPSEINHRGEARGVSITLLAN